MTSKRRDLLIALSLANLWFLWAWEILSGPEYYSHYYLRYPRHISEPLALFIVVLVVATVIWFLTMLARSHASLLAVARWVFPLSLAIPVYSLLHKGESNYDLNRFRLPMWTIWTIAVAGAVVLLLALRWPRKVIHVFLTIVLILAPMLPINLGYSIWLQQKFEPSPTFFLPKQPAVATTTNASAKNRLVWILFDALDQHVAFDRRPSDLQLPELDRLRTESVFATAARSPADETLVAVPTLFTGQDVIAAKPSSPNELQLTLRNNTSVEWSKVENIFSTVKQEGRTTALAGWYHPYCRVIGSNLDSCMWEPLYPQVPQGSFAKMVLANMVNWAREGVYRIPFVKFGSNWRASSRRVESIAAYRQIWNEGLKVAVDANFDVTFIHLPIPHLPGIYDRKTKQLSSAPPLSYVDNLALADATVGELRRALEKNNLWETTTVLITSDHGLRQRSKGAVVTNRAVPFVLKLAGQTRAVEYNTAFETTVTKDLLLGILRGQLVTANDVRSWLDQRALSVAEPAC